MLIQVLCCGRTVEKEGQFWKRSQVSQGAIEKVVLKSTCLSIRYTVLMHSLQQLVIAVTITFCFNLYAWHNNFVVVSGSETENMDLPTKDNITSAAHQCFTKSQDCRCEQYVEMNCCVPNYFCSVWLFRSTKYWKWNLFWYIYVYIYFYWHQ